MTTCHLMDIGHCTDHSVIGHFTDLLIFGDRRGFGFDCWGFYVAITEVLLRQLVNGRHT